MSAQQLAELIERMKNALRVSEEMAGPKHHDYAYALGIAQQELANAVRELERSLR